VAGPLHVIVLLSLDHVLYCIAVNIIRHFILLMLLYIVLRV